jgi:hypothetical protein
MVDTDGHVSGGNGSSMGNHDRSREMFGSSGSAAAAGGAAAGAAGGPSVLRFNVAGSAAGELAGHLAMGSPRGLPKYSGVGKAVLNPVLLDMGTMSKR